MCSKKNILSPSGHHGEPPLPLDRHRDPSSPGHHGEPLSPPGRHCSISEAIHAFTTSSPPGRHCERSEAIHAFTTTLHDFFQTTPPTQTLWVGFSGGVDSHVLLHAMQQANLPHRVCAVHVNHQLSAHADAWAKHCQQVCDDLGVPLMQIQVDARAPVGTSPEAYAREKRYAALSALLQSGDALLTAHHQDDQAETFLLQLFRGAGLPGLASMGIRKPLGKGYLLRPFLSFSQEALLQYAKAHHLCWIEDDSNTHQRFSRNYMRHAIMPLIKARWPQVATTLSRAAAHCAQAQTQLTEAVMMERVAGRQPQTLSISHLKQLPQARCANVIRAWLQDLNFLLPSKKQLQMMMHTFLTSRIDAMPHMRLANYELRRFKEDLYALPVKTILIPTTPLIWPRQTTLLLPGLGRLIPQTKPGANTHHLIIPLQDDAENKLNVRFRVGGERFHPVGRQGSHPLKKLMQDWGVPPWERDRIPLIYWDDVLVCVVGYAVSATALNAAHKVGEDFYFSYEVK